MRQKMECVQVLLPALIRTDEEKEMTKKSRDSIVSFENCVKLTEDNTKYDTAVAGAWNHFLDKWRGKDYDYLMITASDVIHDPMCIDFMVRYMKGHPEAGVVSCKVTRALEDFKKHFGQYKYQDVETRDLKDPATFLLRKGVVEKVGRIDEAFPMEFVERDFLYRIKLAGWKWMQPDIILQYHPDHAGTIGNDIDRLHNALKKYIIKWGGDADQEKFTHPYNNLSLDLTYCEQS